MRTLVLSQSYEPIRVVGWQRAITLLTLGKVEVVEAYDETVRAVSLVLEMPAVVRHLRSFGRRFAPVKFSRVNIYARDRHRCQYCGDLGQPSSLTFDHVVPRSRGGATSWTNIVTACQGCNALKANRTPAEAGMRLRRAPVRPQWVPAMTIRVSTRSVPDAWRDYLYWTGALD